MLTYILVSIAAGILFGAMDGLINANPLARRLNAVYQPIARRSLNLPAGISIDLVYGFILAGLFLLLYPALPGEAGIVKGLSFTAIAWFLRVVMSTVSAWMMYSVPARTLLYAMLTGLAEMLVLGVLFGLTLHPAI